MMEAFVEKVVNENILLKIQVNSLVADNTLMKRNIEALNGLFNSDRPLVVTLNEEQIHQLAQKCAMYIKAGGIQDPKELS